MNLIFGVSSFAIARTTENLPVWGKELSDSLIPDQTQLFYQPSSALFCIHAVRFEDVYLRIFECFFVSLSAYPIFLSF